MHLLVFILLSALLIDLAKPAIITYNTSSTCNPGACYFNDPGIWLGAVVPGIGDEVVIRGVTNAKKRIEIFINSTVTVKSVTLSNYVLLNVLKQVGFLNATTIAWRDPSILQVDAGRVHAASGVWSEVPGSYQNNGTLIVTRGGKFTLAGSTEVGNATLSENSAVQMLNFKVFDTLNISNSHVNVRFIDTSNVITYGSNNIASSSIFVGQYGSFSGIVQADDLSTFSSTHVDFFNATATITDLEVGSLSISSSNLTLTPTHSLLSLNITNSTVIFVSPEDSSELSSDDSSAKNTRDSVPAANETVTFANVILANANISLLTNIVNFGHLQVNSNSTINGNVHVTGGISFTSLSLIVNGNYSQSTSTYMNISTSANFYANVTFLKVYGRLNISETDIYKDTNAPGINGTIRLAFALPGQLTAKVGNIYDPYLPTGLVDTVIIDTAKGHMLLEPSTPKGPKTVYFYEDWRYITAAVLLTLLAAGTFALAKYLRRTRELDERLLEDGDKDQRDDSDNSDEEELEDEEEFDGMGEKRLSSKMV